MGFFAHLFRIRFFYTQSVKPLAPGFFSPTHLHKLGLRNIAQDLQFKGRQRLPRFPRTSQKLAKGSLNICFMTEDAEAARYEAQTYFRVAGPTPRDPDESQ